MYTTTRIDGGNASITPHGDIDYETLPSLLDATRALPVTVTAVVWDLHDVPFMDVAGLHLLSDRRPGSTVTLLGLRPQSQRLLHLAARVFPAAEWAQRPLPATRVIDR
ncbi:STAS domain-containing protein [Streptomyces sp. ICBB 8177]|uniref:STAS domain-containing protein n=1 Tax=Streptomyces sp. ICBB 8177 TaxID=563922 RepID=UPI000D681B4A|nr:STAS domain-containing protein [Streptomyces sp. ICBB 8177]PWI43022.1 hypothetical protein CK485_12375 [Streptomyces sp. ICBB 8177]